MQGMPLQLVVAEPHAVAHARWAAAFADLPTVQVESDDFATLAASPSIQALLVRSIAFDRYFAAAPPGTAPAFHDRPLDRYDGRTAFSTAAQIRSTVGWAPPATSHGWDLPLPAVLSPWVVSLPTAGHHAAGHYDAALPDPGPYISWRAPFRAVHGFNDEGDAPRIAVLGIVPRLPVGAVRMNGPRVREGSWQES
jgi:hypothetical protein